MGIFNQKNPERSGKKARRIAREHSELISAISDVQRREKQEPVKGLRTVFIETFNKHNNFDEAKEAINSNLLNDVIYAGWICEDVFGFNPNTKILNAYQQNNDRESAYACGREINSQIRVEVYTETMIDNLINRYIEEQRKKAIDRDDNNAR